MKLIRELPPTRTYEQALRHFHTEKEIADSLKKADREQRRRIYATMYDELFRKVPDHPRLTHRVDEDQVGKVNAARLALVRDFIDPSTTFVEFACGDCRFAMEVAKHVRRVRGIDISDQRAPGIESPDNFDLIIYDGYRLEGFEPGSADLVFSDQLIEHLHPEDVKHHFELVLKMLKPGGKYVFVTPHAFNGPHDISFFFARQPHGFHLKEWTYAEIRPVLTNLGYSRVGALWRARGIQLKLPFPCFSGSERLLGLLPWKARYTISRLLFPSVCIVAEK